MNIRKKFFAGFLAALLALGCFAGTAAAAEPGRLLVSEKSGSNLLLYIPNCAEIEKRTGQIGTTSCGELSYQPVSEMETPMKTLLLLDNSLSTTENYRPVIQQMIGGIIDNHAEGELFSLATFSEEITYLAEDSADYAELKRLLGKIEYVSQNTHLTDVLYELLSGWAESGEGGFRRIVLFSDGLDNRVIGYTREELMELLKEHAYPIYTIGCAPANEQNADGLENMFALSRATGGISWLFEDITDPDEVVMDMTQLGDVLCVTIPVPESLCDGAKRGVKLSVQTASETIELSTEMEMPFGVAAEEEASGGIPLYAIVLVAVIVAAAAGVVIWQMRRREQNETRFQTAPVGAAPRLETMPEVGTPEGSTEMLTDVSYSSGETAMIWETGRVILTDEKNGGRRFEAPLMETVKIGRGRDTGCTIVLDYDTSVSRRPHCQIRMENGVAMVKDLGSSNGTYLNGRRLEREAVLSDGDTLKIGRVEMRVELR